MCPASQSAGLINLFSPPDPGELLKRALPLAGGHQMPALNYSSLWLLGEREGDEWIEQEKKKKHEKGGEGGGVKEALSQLAGAMIKSRDVSIV